MADPARSLRIRLLPADAAPPADLAELLTQAAAAISRRRRSGEIGQRRTLAQGEQGNACDDDPDCKYIQTLPNGWLMYLCDGEEVFYPPG